MFIRPNGIVAFCINDQIRQQIRAKNSLAPAGLLALGLVSPGCDNV
jgi:hypothetical protein